MAEVQPRDVAGCAARVVDATITALWADAYADLRWRSG